MSLKEELWSLISKVDVKMMNNFDRYSLLINGSEIAKSFYLKKPRNTQVSPIGNISQELRTRIEMTKIYKQPQLVSMYDNELKNLTSEDYFLKTISIIDGMFEDIYELILLAKGEDEDKIGRYLVFHNDRLPHVLIKELPKIHTIKNSDGYELEDYFLTYEIYRQIRHAIIHNNSNIKERHEKKIRAVSNLISEKHGYEFKYENISFIKNNEVNLNLNDMAELRLWSVTFLAFLLLGIEEIE